MVVAMHYEISDRHVRLVDVAAPDREHDIRSFRSYDHGQQVAYGVRCVRCGETAYAHPGHVGDAVHDLEQKAPTCPANR